jgi:cytochrome bd-type quinol oxidase subunit 2
MDLNKWKKVLTISILIFVMAVIIVIFTADNVSVRIIWNIARVVTFITIVIMGITVVASTVICKNNNEQKPKWLNIAQIVTVIIVSLTIIITIATISTNKKTTRSRI